MAYPEFLIDKRVVQRNVAKGIVDSAEYEKMLASLPDAQSNADYVPTDTRSTEREPAED